MLSLLPIFKHETRLAVEYAVVVMSGNVAEAFVEHTFPQRIVERSAGIRLIDGKLVGPGPRNHAVDCRERHIGRQEVAPVCVHIVGNPQRRTGAGAP